MHVVVAGFDHFQIKSCTTPDTPTTMRFPLPGFGGIARKPQRSEKIADWSITHEKFRPFHKFSRDENPLQDYNTFVVVIGLPSIHCHLNRATIAYDSTIVTNSIFTNTVEVEDSQIDPIYIHNHGKIHRRQRRRRRRSPL